MLQLMVFIKLLLFGLLLEKSFGNIEDEASKDKNLKRKSLKIFHAWFLFHPCEKLQRLNHEHESRIRFLTETDSFINGGKSYFRKVFLWLHGRKTFLCAVFHG